MIFLGGELGVAKAGGIQAGNSDVMGIKLPKYGKLFLKRFVAIRHMAAAIVNGVQRDGHTDHHSRHGTAAISQKEFFRLGRRQDENGQALKNQAQRQQRNECRLEKPTHRKQTGISKSQLLLATEPLPKSSRKQSILGEVVEEKRPA